MEPDHKHLTGLPLSLVSPVDLGRVIRELEQLENHLNELRIRTPGQEIKMPKTTKLMDDLLNLNQLNLLQAADRKTLKQFLSVVKQRAPRLHISFSADPSPLFVEKIMTWLRKEVHPVVLLTTGLQPNIGAGCIVRTTNKYFDFSLAKDFEKKRDVLMQALRDAPVKEAAPQAVTTTPAHAQQTVSTPAATAPAAPEKPLAKPTNTYLATPASPASATTEPGAPKLAAAHAEAHR
ncbi:MAG TPA: hypothetical protein VFH39_04850 [Candidatus Saccharimonadales bacterium]|nr:hypothetical protein [Candidatus Saccharimonadales bacterium]